MSFFDNNLAELDRLERSVVDQDGLYEDEPSPQKIHQWQHLFNYSSSQAINKIKQRRADLGHLIINDAAWEEMRSDKEAQGFDKDAWEHYLEAQAKADSRLATSPPPLSQGTASATYLLRLEPPLSDLQLVETLIGCQNPLEVEVDDDDPSVRFCRLTASQRGILLSKSSFHPTLIRLSLSSRKDLDPDSKYPTLGIESTLPQHRLQTAELALPSQDQYPVWYFFYGNLAVPSILSKRLQVPEDALEFHHAHISGGIMSSWGGKYRALMDGDCTSAATILGSGFLVKSREMEDTLRMYETDRYEVVRCRMTLADNEQEVDSCTFKFLG